MVRINSRTKLFEYNSDYNLELQVILDNSTRWNSTYLSIQRALLVRKRIDSFWFEHLEDLSQGELKEPDWQHLEHLVKSLHPFYEITKRLEGLATSGHHGAIWEALPALILLMEQMENGRVKWERQMPRGQPNPSMVAHQNAWEKLNKYYAVTDLSHSIYDAAVLLHPSYRKHFFDYHWVGDEEQWKAIMIGNVKKTWQEHYRPQVPLEPTAVQLLGIMDQFLRRTQVGQPEGDQFDSYISGSTTTYGTDSADSPISWLLGPENFFPGITQQAIDLLSIPAMSAELERCFRQAKHTVTPTRSRMTDETLEMHELLRHWWVNNTVAQRRGGGGRAHRKRKRLYPQGEGGDEGGDDEVV